MKILLNVIIILLVLILLVLVVLYFMGKKVEKQRVEQQGMLEAAAQTVTILVIDKKKMKVKDANLPKIVYEQTPKYLRWAKVPIVRAKVGARIVDLIADDKAYIALPVKTEAKVVISGIYLSEIKSIRNGGTPKQVKKEGFLDKLTAKFRKK